VPEGTRAEKEECRNRCLEKGGASRKAKAVNRGEAPEKSGDVQGRPRKGLGQLKENPEGGKQKTKNLWLEVLWGSIKGKIPDRHSTFPDLQGTGGKNTAQKEKRLKKTPMEWKKSPQRKRLRKSVVSRTEHRQD